MEAAGGSSIANGLQDAASLVQADGQLSGR